MGYTPPLIVPVFSDRITNAISPGALEAPCAYCGRASSGAPQCDGCSALRVTARRPSPARPMPPPWRNQVEHVGMSHSATVLLIACLCACLAVAILGMLSTL